MIKDLVNTWKVIACQLQGNWLPESIFREFRYHFAFLAQPRPTKFSAKQGQVYEVWQRV